MQDHSQTRPGHTKTLLIIGFGSVLAILLTAAMVSLGSISSMTHKLSQVINGNTIRHQHAFKMYSAARERTMILHEMARTDDPFKRDELFMELRERGEAFLMARQKILDLGLDKQSKELLDLQREYSSYAGELQYKVIDLLNNQQTDEAINTLIDEVIPAQNQTLDTIDQFMKLQQQHNNNSLRIINTEFEQSFQTIVLLTLIGIVISAFVSGTIYWRIRLIFNTLYDNKLREDIIRDNIADAVVTYNDNGIIESCNKAIKDIFGFDPGDMIGDKITRLIPIDDISYSITDRNTPESTPTVNSKQRIQCKHKNGVAITLYASTSRVTFNNRFLYISILIDVTEQIKNEQLLQELNEKLETRVEERTRELQLVNEKLKYLANHDTITDLPNRALLSEHLNHILASANRLKHKVALMFLDIDDFKQINDFFGHETGDMLLKEIGYRLTTTLRQSDLVSRVGGDEFIIVLDDTTDTKTLEAIAHKLIELISKPFIIKDNICRIGVSIGISIYPDNGADVETLIRCADKAMYKIKNTSKNNLQFYSEQKLQ